MTKRKILLLAMSLCMVAILAVGGTLAYFTDTETKDNVFTVGNVDIEINENFDQNATLLPNEENKTQKEVFVENTGTGPAYVRVHIAIPSDLVDQDINSYNDILHVNMTGASIQVGEWSWLPASNQSGKGWVGNGRANNNTYNVDIDGVNHTVWVVTYMEKIEADQSTRTPAISWVYMDKYTEATANADGTITYTKPVFVDGNRNEVVEGAEMSYTASAIEGQPKPHDEMVHMTIKIVAEAVQAESFDDAYEALNTGFGKPSATNNPWTGYADPWTVD